MTLADPVLEAAAEDVGSTGSRSPLGRVRRSRVKFPLGHFQ